MNSATAAEREALVKIHEIAVTYSATTRHRRRRADQKYLEVDRGLTRATIDTLQLGYAHNRATR